MSEKPTTVEKRFPVPPFTEDTARQKVQLAEDAWNSQNPEKIALAYTPDSKWRNRDKFVNGRTEIVQFLKDKWARELDYKLKKEYFCHNGNRIAVRYEYESRDKEGQWYRSYGNENWIFDENGYMAERYSSINDVPIKEEERKFK